MANARAKKLTLPKSVLEMKFMKKTRERVDNEVQNTQGHDTLYSDIITNEMRHATGNFITECSFIFCEDLIEGRMSFKGMNPEIEALMESENRKHTSGGDMDKDISDVVLAKKMAAFNESRKRPYVDSPTKVPIVKKGRGIQKGEKRKK